MSVQQMHQYVKHTRQLKHMKTTMFYKLVLIFAAGTRVIAFITMKYSKLIPLLWQHHQRYRVAGLTAAPTFMAIVVKKLDGDIVTNELGSVYKLCMESSNKQPFYGKVYK